MCILLRYTNLKFTYKKKSYKKMNALQPMLTTALQIPALYEGSGSVFQDEVSANQGRGCTEGTHSVLPLHFSVIRGALLKAIGVVLFENITILSR